MRVNDVPLGARADVERLLHPSGVALVGGFDRAAPPDRVLAPFRKKWGDSFHLVDAAGGRVGDVPVHPSVAELPAHVDVAVLAVPRGELLAAVDDCGRRGVGSVIVTTSGLAELGGEGEDLERRLVAAARGHGMRVLGPNANTNLYDAMPPPAHPSIGKIALVTQSGHMGRVIFQASPHGVAFSRWVPTGNEADLDAADFVEYFAHDDDTAVVAAYVEGFRDGLKLRRALAAAAERGKPVVVIKVGRHEAASRMASSHTAHLTGADAIVDGLFRQYGVLRVDDVDELIETAALHAKLAPAPRGPRVALYGISGGAVALMAEQAEAHGVPVPVLADGTQRRLHEVLPAHLGVSNPVDNGNLYRVGTAERRRRVFDVMCEDESVDLLVCALTGVIPGITDDFASDILEFRARSETPVVATWNTWELGSPAYDALVASGIPLFRSFRNCFRALAGYFDHRRRVELARTRPLPAAAPPVEGPGRTLGPAEAAALLERHGVPTVAERLVDSADAAAAAAAELGYPVVVKAPLEGFPHKSDAGLVVTGVADAGELAAAVELLAARSRELQPGLERTPLLVQRQAARGVELIVGVTRDETLGPAVLVGLGGVFTEVLRDVSVRPVPITSADAAEMLRELRGYELLEGVRGAPRADVEALERLLVAVGALAADGEAGVLELDLNPVLATPGGVVAVDSLVVVGEGGERPAGHTAGGRVAAPARA